MMTWVIRSCCRILRNGSLGSGDPLSYGLRPMKGSESKGCERRCVGYVARRISELHRGGILKSMDFSPVQCALDKEIIDPTE